MLARQEVNIQSILDEIGTYNPELAQIVSDQEQLHQQALADPSADSRMTFITDFGVSDQSGISLFVRSRVGVLSPEPSVEEQGIARLVGIRYSNNPLRICMTERVLWQQPSEICLYGLAAALDSGKNIEFRVLEDAAVAEHRDGLGIIERTNFLVPHGLQTFYAGPNNPILRRWEADEVVAAADRHAFSASQSWHMLEKHLLKAEAAQTASV